MTRFKGETSGSKHERWTPTRSRFRRGERHPHRALFIGINYTGDAQLRLKGCQEDCVRARKALGKIGFVPGEERTMTDLSAGRDHPTRENIIEAMQWLVDGADAGDVMFMHFSGHGERVKDRSGDEEDGFDEALVPIDARTAGLIADDVINSIMVETLPRGATLYAVFDCCHSGTIMDIPYVYDEAGNRMIKIPGSSSEGQVVMLSGCLHDQKSADMGPDLMKGINKSVGALSNALYGGFFHRNRIAKGYTWQSLVTEVRTHIRNSKLHQIPQLEASSPIDPNSRAFAKLYPETTRKQVAPRVSNRPRANDASQLPLEVLGAYKAAGKTVAGWKKYALSGKLKSQVMGFFTGNKNTKRSASKKGKSKKNASASSSDSYSDDDYSYDSDYSDYDGDYSDYSDY